MPISKTSRDAEDRYIINYIKRLWPGYEDCIIHPGVLGDFYHIIVEDHAGYYHKLRIKIPARFKRRRKP